MATDFNIAVRFYRLSPALRPYFTALYMFDIDCPEGAIVEDYLHPEWAAMRFTHGTVPIACIGPGELAEQWPFVVSGPNGAIHVSSRGALAGRGTRAREVGSLAPAATIAAGCSPGAVLAPIWWL